jgi:hypothetical protein
MYLICSAVSVTRSVKSLSLGDISSAGFSKSEKRKKANIPRIISVNTGIKRSLSFFITHPFPKNQRNT